MLWDAPWVMEEQRGYAERELGSRKKGAAARHQGFQGMEWLGRVTPLCLPPKTPRGPSNYGEGPRKPVESPRCPP